MSGAIGINNGNSQHAQLEREYLEPRTELREIVKRPITRAELNMLAIYFSAKHDIALYEHKEVAVKVQEENLSALTEYAEVMQ